MRHQHVNWYNQPNENSIDSPCNQNLPEFHGENEDSVDIDFDLKKNYETREKNSNSKEGSKENSIFVTKTGIHSQKETGLHS